MVASKRADNGQMNETISIKRPKEKSKFMQFFHRAFGKTKGTIIFNTINYLLFFFVGFVTLYPFLYIFRISIQSVELINGVSTKVYSLAAYKVVLQNNTIVRAFIVTVFVVLADIASTLLITFFGAYSLSKKYFKGRNVILFMLLITMLFSGGLIPHYILITQVLKWRNNYLVYFVPGLVNAYNVFVVKSFLQGIPDSLEEAARLDGANDVTILVRVFIPLSGPIIATIALWTGVGMWNDWMTGVLYITNANMRIIQNLLRDMLILASSTDASGHGGDRTIMAMAENVKMATVVIGTLPIIMIYPFVQKYFVKGMLVGSVKG